MKRPLFIDMDDVLADFQSSEAFNPDRPTEDQLHEMYEPGFFRNLKPVAGAQKAVRALINMGYHVEILTQALAESPTCYKEKAEWIAMYFPELIKRINMTQDKGHFIGEFLIDDNPKKWKDKFEANGGKFIHYDYTRNNDARNRILWETIVLEFESRKRNE